MFSARASPSGPVSDETFEHFLEEFHESLQGAHVDGVILALHGAMMTASREDPEGELLTVIGDLVDDIPLMATIDPHAHLTPRMVDATEALLAYQTTPHVDILETGQRGMRLMTKTIRGSVRPEMAMVKVPTMLTNNQLFYERVKTLESEHESVLSATYSAVQAFVDATDMGHVGLVITNDSPALATELATELGREIWARREEGVRVRDPDRPTVAEVFERISSEGSGSLSVLMDDGDHMVAGAPGDSPVFLRELIHGNGTQNLKGAIQIVDKPAVAELVDTGTGPETVQIGGKLTTGFSPLTVEGRVESVHEDPLTIRGKLYPGTEDFFGTRVVFELSNYDVKVILSEQSGLANDPPFFEEHGVDLDTRDFVVIQCGHNVADYEELSDDIVRVKSPGVTSNPYTFIRKGRPIYPLDQPEPSFDVFNGWWELRKD
jgi:microcystin degradation protein MlrC